MRKLKNIDIDSFCQHILLSQLYLSQSSDLDSLIDQYESVLSELLDKHAPLITRRITCRPHAPWFDDELREAKRQVRRCERKWMKSKLEIHRLIFREKAHRYHELIKKAKCDFHKSQLENCNSRDLFAKINTLCKPKSAKILPSAQSSDIPLVERFSDFFCGQD